MSIENNAPQSGQETQVKMPWVAPVVQIIDMDAARFGPTFGNKDNGQRS